MVLREEQGVVLSGRQELDGHSKVFEHWLSLDKTPSGFEVISVEKREPTRDFCCSSCAIIFLGRA